MAAETQKGPAAPYTSYQSIKTMVKDMKAHGVPGRIDRSVLTNFSGAVGGQILTALKFLELTNDDGVPTDQMKLLVDSYDTDTWNSVMATLVKKAYSPIFQLDLKTASPNQFNEKFKLAYSGTDDVLRKSITFFLNAARDGLIEISPYIMKNKKPRAVSKKRVQKIKDPAEHVRHDKPPEPSPQFNPEKRNSTQILMDLLDVVRMTDEEQQAVWTLLRYTKKEVQTVSS